MGRTRLYWISALVALAVAGVALVPLRHHDEKVHPTMTQSGQRLQMPLHAEGSRIVDASGETVTFTGVSWFGLETKPDFEVFKDWWHRMGKQGADLKSKADADQAYADFKADKNRPK